MKRTIVGSLVALVLSTTALYAADEIKVGGGGASIATVFKPVKSHFEKDTGSILVISQSTPKNGLIDLMNGTVDVATAGVPLEAMIKGAEKEGVKVNAAALESKVVAVNRTVVLVHPSNSVQTLTKEQLKGIFTGKFVNWKEVGGSDSPILVAWGKLTPGQNAQFSAKILDGEAVMKDIIDTTDYFGIKDTVAATPEAIGIDPFALGADGTVKVLLTEPPLNSDIIVVTKGKPSAKAQKLISYITGAGSKYIIK